MSWLSELWSLHINILENESKPVQRSDLGLVMCLTPLLFGVGLGTKRLLRRVFSSAEESGKAGKTGWSLVWHGAMFLLEVTALWRMPWYGSTTGPWTHSTTPFWDDFPQFNVTPALKLLYLYQLSYYLQDAVSYVLVEAPPDMWAMVAHHISAFVLISLSYFYGLVRIGSGILLIHEFSDIFLYLAKLLHYCAYDLAANATFATLIITWFYSRLICLPRVIWSDAFESQRDTSELVCLVFLLVLQVLHVYWWFQMLRVLRNAMNSGEVTDGSTKHPVCENLLEVEASPSTASPNSQAGPRKRSSSVFSLSERSSRSRSGLLSGSNLGETHVTPAITS